MFFNSSTLRKFSPFFKIARADGLFSNTPSLKIFDAISNLQTDQTKGGIHFPTTNLNSHLIASDFIPGDQSSVDLAIPQDIPVDIGEWEKHFWWVKNLSQVIIISEKIF